MEQETRPLWMYVQDAIGHGSDVFGMASQQSPVQPYRIPYATPLVRDKSTTTSLGLDPAAMSTVTQFMSPKPVSLINFPVPANA